MNATTRDLGPHRVAGWRQDGSMNVMVNYLKAHESCTIMIQDGDLVPMASFWQERRLTLRERLAVRAGAPDPRRDLVMVELFDERPPAGWWQR